MELDKRIKSLSDILTCFDVERAKEFLGEKGYFAGDLYCFTDLQRACPYGTLADVFDDPDDVFRRREDSINYSYFVPECSLKPKEKQYRAFTIDEFLDRFHFGEVIVFRSKATPNIVCHVLFVGYTETGKENGTFITLGQHRYSLQELFISYERFYLGRWYPFGEEVKE